MAPINRISPGNASKKRIHNHSVKRHKSRKQKIKRTFTKKTPKKFDSGFSKNFPWAKEIREFKRPNFSITIYADGSRLYLFKKGGHLIVTPQGMGILKQNPGLIKQYLKGEKFPINAGGNSTISVIRTTDQPLVVKEHHTGMSAHSQIEHMKQIREAFERARSEHSAPKYYAVAGIHPELGLRSKTTGALVRDVSVMDFVAGKKLSIVVEELKMKGDRKSMQTMSKILDDFKAFKAYLRKKKMPVTDMHDGNVLAKYDDKSRKYRFTIIDQ